MQVLVLVRKQVRMQLLIHARDAPGGQPDYVNDRVAGRASCWAGGDLRGLYMAHGMEDFV